MHEMRQQQPGLYPRPNGLALPVTCSGTVTCAPLSDTTTEREGSKPVAHMVECSLPCAEGKIVDQQDERNETPAAPAGMSHRCALGTQFESSEPHHAVARSRRFPERTTNARHWRAFTRGESLCDGPADFQGGLAGLSLALNLHFPETGDPVSRDWVGIFRLTPR